MRVLVEIKEGAPELWGASSVSQTGEENAVCARSRTVDEQRRVCVDMVREHVAHKGPNGVGFTHGDNGEEGASVQCVCGFREWVSLWTAGLEETEERGHVGELGGYLDSRLVAQEVDIFEDSLKHAT